MKHKPIISGFLFLLGLFLLRFSINDILYWSYEHTTFLAYLNVFTGFKLLNYSNEYYSRLLKNKWLYYNTLLFNDYDQSNVVKSLLTLGFLLIGVFLVRSGTNDILYGNRDNASIWSYLYVFYGIKMLEHTFKPKF